MTGNEQKWPDMTRNDQKWQIKNKQKMINVQKWLGMAGKLKLEKVHMTKNDHKWLKII